MRRRIRHRGSFDRLDGGEPEEERRFADVFPDLILAIKYQGTTSRNIGNRFSDITTSYWGTVCSHGRRNLAYLSQRFQEMNLARLEVRFRRQRLAQLRTPLALIRLYAKPWSLGG